MRLLDMIRPKPKVDPEKLLKDEQEKQKLDEDIRRTKQMKRNLVDEMCWGWVKDHSDQVSKFKNGDPVIFNPYVTGFEPVRRDLFVHPEEGIITTRGLPCFELIHAEMEKDKQDLVLRRAKGWIDHDYFLKLLQGNFDEAVQFFFWRYGVGISNPVLKRNFNDGIAVIPERFLVLRDGEEGVVLHSISLMERHIMEQQDALLKMYATLEEFTRRSDDSRASKEEIAGSNGS